MQTIPTYDELVYSQELSKYRVSDKSPVEEVPLLIEGLPPTRFNLRSTLSRPDSERKEKLRRLYSAISKINMECQGSKSEGIYWRVISNTFFKDLMNNAIFARTAAPYIKRRNYNKSRVNKYPLSKSANYSRNKANRSLPNGPFSLTPIKSLNIYDTRAKVKRDFEKELDRDTVLQAYKESRVITKQLEDDYRNLCVRDETYSSSYDGF